MTFFQLCSVQELPLAAHDELTTDKSTVVGISDMFDICCKSWGTSAVRVLLKPTETSMYTDKTQQQLPEAEHIVKH